MMKTRPRFRTCMCENGDWLDNSECGKLFEIAIKCPFIPPEDPRCSEFLDILLDDLFHLILRFTHFIPNLECVPTIE